MEESHNHNGFKLIGIIPLKDCHQQFRKNLEIGKQYLFYNNYNVTLKNDNSTIINVTINKSGVPNTMYNIENGIKINVSALVGANGSGKSALIELFYYFVYAISSLNDSNLEFKKYSEFIRSEKDELEIDKDQYNNAQNKQRFGLYLQNKYEIQIELKNDNSDYNRLLIEKLDDRIHLTDRRLKTATEIDLLVDKSLNVLVIYEVNGDVFINEYIEGKLIVKNQNGEKIKDSFNFQDFFYSISLNYSHHSLNSRSIGEWINSLFHKNDGYRTPVVINPMRTDGMFNINNELELSNERLMFNLAYYLIQSQKNEDGYKLLEKYKIKSVNLSIKTSSYPYPLGDNYSINKLSSYFLIKDIVNENNSTEITHLSIIIGYLERKLEKIRKNYSSIIFKNYDVTKHNKKEEYFQTFILGDNSHITKKIKQLVNYLKYATKNINTKTNSIFNLEPLESISYTSDEFLTFIKDNKKEFDRKKTDSLTVLELMNYLPPSIFNIDFELTLNNNESILLSELSSGEQQMIFNINTIMYHLYNLQSSFLSNNTRLVYKNVNIFLDEIELYYHPEMQRQFLKSLLDSLELVKSKKSNQEKSGIESINICFLTHSPFILSDIPSQNILKIKEGKPESADKINSFAANIYDLLQDEFFLKNGAIGAYAQDYINDLIQEINELISSFDELKINQLKNKISIIGDEFIRHNLEDFLLEKVNDDQYEIELLKKKIKELESKNKDYQAN